MRIRTKVVWDWWHKCHSLPPELKIFHRFAWNFLELGSRWYVSSSRVFRVRGSPCKLWGWLARRALYRYGKAWGSLSRGRTCNGIPREEECRLERGKEQCWGSRSSIIILKDFNNIHKDEIFLAMHIFDLKRFIDNEMSQFDVLK